MKTDRVRSKHSGFKRDKARIPISPARAYCDGLTFKVNKMIVKKLVIGMFSLGLTCAANAGVIEFDTCQSGCGFLDADRGDTVTSVATLQFEDNGQNGVDFTLTNNIGDVLAGNDTSFIPRLFLGFSQLPTDIINATANIDFFDLGGSTNSGLDFDLEVNLANVLSTGLRITDGQSASWTFQGFQESSVLLPALLQIVERTPDGTTGARLLGTFTPVQQVPEPGPLGLSLLAIGLMAFRSRKMSQASKAQ